MLGEYYRYDEPVGLYGFESGQRLAEAAVREFVRHEKIQPIAEPSDIADLLGLDAAYPGDFRLSTLVSRDNSSGHALAVTATDQEAQQGTYGTYFSIDLDDIAVIEAKSIFVAHSSLLISKYAIETEAGELKGKFTKPQLEAISRMVGKLTAGLEVAARISKEELPAQNTVGSIKAMSSQMRQLEVVKRATSIEPRALRALQYFMLDDLSSLFPATYVSLGQPTLPESDLVMVPGTETENMSAWDEFIQAASDRFRREGDRSEAEAAFALHHVQNDMYYVICINATYGNPSGVHLLAWNSLGEGLYQGFDLEQDEDSDDLIINPAWDKIALLAAVKHGEPITQQAYQTCAQKALEDHGMTFNKAELYNLGQEHKKRRAA